MKYKVLLLFTIVIVVGYFFLSESNSLFTKNKKITSSIKQDVVITPIKYSIVESQYKGSPHLYYFNSEKEHVVVADEYYNILKQKILDGRLSAQTWFQNRCNDFWLLGKINKKGVEYYSIERHGYHQDGCPGDPNFSPRYDVFLINTKTKGIIYEDFIHQKEIAFDQWAETISKE